MDLALVRSHRGEYPLYYSCCLSYDHLSTYVVNLHYVQLFLHLPDRQLRNPNLNLNFQRQSCVC